MLAARFRNTGNSASSERAVVAVALRFGAAWRQRFHRSHRLTWAGGLVFCRVCGRYCDAPQHIVGLAKPCGGPPGRASVYNSRLTRAASGRHPLTGQRLPDGRAAALPAGLR